MHQLLFRGRLCLTLLLTLLPGLAMASETHGMPTLGGIRLEFILFALTLLGVALFHHYTMWISLGGLALVLLSKYLFLDDFSMLHHLLGGVGQEGEWRVHKYTGDPDARRGAGRLTMDWIVEAQGLGAGEILLIWRVTVAGGHGVQ